MGLAANVGLRGIVLGVERVEVLLKPLVGRDAGIDRAANGLRRPGIHGADPFDGLSRNPKNLGPLHRVPVIANATFVRLRKVLPFQAKPSVKTATRCICPFHSRPSMVPGLSSAVRWLMLTARCATFSGDPERSSRRTLSASKSPS